MGWGRGGNSKNSICVPKGEKKQLIKFVPSRSLPRGREIKFATALLAWQQLGEAGSCWSSLWEKVGTNSQRTKSRISSSEASSCYTDAVRKKPGQSRSAPRLRELGSEQQLECWTAVRHQCEVGKHERVTEHKRKEPDGVWC